jgi:ribonuclease inhibitor
MMKEIVFDSIYIENMDQLHAEFARILDFPAHYGRNLDALYDCLSGEVGLPLKIIWKNYRLTQSKIGKDIEKILEVMEDFSREEPDFVVQVE